MDKKQKETIMHRVPLAILAALLLLLAGCASTIESDVTAFHDWPANLSGKSYVFERTRAQNDSLEYRSYENMVRAELQRLGFAEAAVHATPILKVAFDYQTKERDVRVVQPVVVNPGWWGPPYYGPRWPGYRFRDPFFYDPFWYGPPVAEYRDSSFRLYDRQLHIVISRMSDGKKLYDVTVKNESRAPSTAAVMPYMVKSAFADFPGPNGVPRRVGIKTAN